MRCLHHPFVLVSWFRGFVRRRPSIVVVVFIEVGFWCGGARVSSSSGLLLLLFRQVSRDDPDRDGLDDGFLRRRRRCLHPRLRVRFGRKALRRHRSRIEKERKKKKRFFGVVRTDMVRSLYASHSRKDDTKARCSSKRGKRRGNAKCVSIYLVRRARIRAHLRVALVPGVVHPDGSTARNRVVLFFLLLSFVRLLSAAAAFFSRGRRHYWCESGVCRFCLVLLFPCKSKDERRNTKTPLSFFIDKP